jgi:hypothetical protein
MFAAASSSRTLTLAISLATTLACGTCFGQSVGYSHGSMPMGPVYPAMPAYSGYSGYGNSHSSTLAEGILNGSAAVIDATGRYNLNTSQAEIYDQQARALDRENDLKQTEALLAQKKMWSDASIKERKDSEVRAADGRKRIAEKQATIFRQAYWLSNRELNLRTGEITWPAALQDPRFQENRERLDVLFHECLGYGAPNAEVAQEIVHTIEQWSRTLRNETAVMPRQDYLAAQKFLMGLKYSAASFAPAA